MAHLRRLPWLIVSLIAVGVAAVVADPGDAVDTQPAAATEAPALPAGSTTPGRAGAEASAIALADALLAVPTGPDADDICPRDRLEVSWKKPSPKIEHGAYLTPVGPTPDADTRQVNGVVLCDLSAYGFMGFEAAWDGEQWTVYDVPFVGEEGHGDDDRAKGSPDVDLPSGLADIRKGSPWYGRWGRQIEPLSIYEPQQVCDPAPKPALTAFRGIIQGAYEYSRHLGISRPCTVGARSEHKEGRAWDWGVAVNVPVERRAANEVISWLLATDEYGNKYAMARRLGLMYVIWDRHIWSSYQASAGWRPYAGLSPHTDHVHLSFNRSGALGNTSFWNGADLDDLPAGAFSEFADDLGFPATFFLGGSLPAPPELGPAARPAAGSSGGGRATSGKRGTTTGSRPGTRDTNGGSDRPSTGGGPSGGDPGEVASPTGLFPGGSTGTGTGTGSGTGTGTGGTTTTQPPVTLLPGLPLPLPTTTTRPAPTTTSTTRRPSTTTSTTSTTLLPLPTLPTLPKLPGL